MRSRAGWLGTAVFAALAVGTVGSAPALVLRGVVGTGGTPASGSTGSGHVMRGTVGQPVVGASAGSSKELCHGYWCVGGAAPVAVEEPPPGAIALPERFDLGPARPNPARGVVGFTVALPRSAAARLEIYDLDGRRVDQTWLGDLPAGYRAVRWSGAPAVGVYFARLVVEGRSLVTRRFVVLR
jgi:hypothetical protein